MFSLSLPQTLLCSLLSLPLLITAQSNSCPGYERIFAALKANQENGSDSFCQQYLAAVSYIGTLREDPTLFYYDTVTDTSSTETVYVAATTTTKTKITSTSFASQKRTGTSRLAPLPSYVQQYPTERVSKGCSCFYGPGPTYTQYRPCEQATTTTTVKTTFTYTVGKPGAITSTFTDTSTKTKLKYETAGYPFLCPGAESIDYVASDRSIWDRGCKTFINQYRELGEVKAPDFRECIEKCVDYNVKIGYQQCQAVFYYPKTNTCMRINEPGYFYHGEGGPLAPNVASIRFKTPLASPTDYCATVPGAG